MVLALLSAIPSSGQSGTCQGLSFPSEDGGSEPQDSRVPSRLDVLCCRHFFQLKGGLRQRPPSLGDCVLFLPH